MKKRNHPANVVDVSSRIMGLLGRRKVDPTTKAMRALKGLQDIQIARGVGILAAGIVEPDEVYVLPLDPPKRLPLHIQQCGRFMRPTESPSLDQWAQISGRIERANRQPGLTPDEQQRLIDVLEKHLS